MTNEVFDPASAKAIEEAAKFGSKAIDAGTGLAAYLDRVLGRLPDNIIGFLGDWIEHTRIRRAAELWAETEKHLHRLGVNKPVDVSPSVLVPLLEAALNEDRAVLKELWAKLLAAAMDPNRTEFVRPSLIALLKQMDPLDARVLESLAAGAHLNTPTRDVADQRADATHPPAPRQPGTSGNKKRPAGAGRVDGAKKAFQMDWKAPVWCLVLGAKFDPYKKLSRRALTAVRRAAPPSTSWTAACISSPLSQWPRLRRRPQRCRAAETWRHWPGQARL